MLTQRTFIFIWNSNVRNHGTKTFVLNKTKKPKMKGMNRAILEAQFRNKFYKKNVKIHLEKQASDYCEELWLDTINFKNLKLYRKTSFGELQSKGSFRKVNVKSLINKLMVLNSTNDIKNNIEMKKHNKHSEHGNECVNNDSKSDLAPPQMSEFLVKNLLNFPLLKSCCSDNISFLVKDEREEYGLVDAIKFPAVTTILHETMSESARERLEEWKKKMISKLGYEEFQKYSKNPAKVIEVPSVKLFKKNRRKRKQILVDLLNQGAKFHHCLKTYLEKGTIEGITLDPEIEGCWTSLNELLPDITNVRMVEKSIYHPMLMYRGVVDCFADYKNTPCIIEWKKSEKTKSDLAATHDAPLQLCAYLGAISWQKTTVLPSHGLVVVAYTNGNPANIFSLDLESCEYYWGQWLRRLQTYWLNRSSILIEKPEL